MDIFQKIKRFLPDGFILALLSMIVLAWFVPGIGAKGSAIELKTVAKYGIVLLFFFYGLKLSPEKMINDLKNWKLHLTIQLLTFVFIPVVVLLFYPFFRNSEYFQLWLAVFFLATLPSTVSSSVVMVSIARGNIPGAIFNASISGIIGIIVTPFWMSLFLKASTSDFNFSKTLLDLVVQILLPVIAGLFFHRFWGKWADRNKKFLSLFDKSVILLIVYSSFSDSFTSGIFSSIPNWTLFVLSGAVIGLFFIVFSFSNWISKKMEFNREDQITVAFCGSKKSLVHGSVFSSVLLAGSTAASLFLVPIMIYHAFQLFYISLIAKKTGKEER
ncbi:MAG TPA: bile acid:sodium symporter family protein [Prolixibacteraceae bacterium]|nr:bile acid:sodium symporter family protein [Prolixibacteraceae bacterium]HPS13025.1 bile acid:sodium symporter family protein [Prolixibacteraceae bacterium]